MQTTKGRAPNILVTGTPGTGKTTTCELIAEASNLRYINVGDWVQKGSLHSGWDEQHQSFIIDEDKVYNASLRYIEAAMVSRSHFWQSGACLRHRTSLLSRLSQLCLIRQVCDALEDHLSQGGNIVDYHGCDFFPERWGATLMLSFSTDLSR